MGVLVMSYGSPASSAQVESYYTHVRRGQAPTAAQLDDLRRRYAAIGGLSPLAQRTRGQAEGLQAELERSRPGRYVVVVGSKHAQPFIEDGVTRLASRQVSRIIALVMAPHFSVMSVGEYMGRAEAAAESHGLDLVAIPSWHTEEAVVSLLAQRLKDALSHLPQSQADSVPVLFTAHSLPIRALAGGDPYPDQVGETAQAVAQAAGVDPVRVQVAWQSAGRTPEPWIGPDIGEVIRSLAAEQWPAVVVCPVGFTSDHLEILYDLDIKAHGLAHSLGLDLVRTKSLNDDPAFMTALATVVQRADPVQSSSRPSHLPRGRSG
ncbi:MAG: ferrochelatase [Acidimicrobiales bacterium]